MAQSKPSQFAVSPTGDESVDKIQNSLKQTTEAVRNAPPPRQAVTELTKNKPNQGIVFKPGQIVDVPHNLGKVASGFNISKIITNTPNGSSMPIANPNLQVVPVPGPLGQKIMRLRYVAPTRYNPATNQNETVDDPVRLHLELF
jgi:hypothetical protein